MPTSMAICTKCQQTYFINSNEMKVLPTMNIYQSERGNIRKWSDWIKHLQSYCPNCRFQKPPLHAVEDYKKHEEYIKKGDNNV